MPEIVNTWKRILQNFIGTVSKVASSERSGIHNACMIARVRIEQGEEIGHVRFGGEVAQGEHTLEVAGVHRLVKRPWRDINHSCAPSPLRPHKFRQSFVAFQYQRLF